ncbi:FG-GAP-like repeat-containing protein [Flammeovirga sp. OC4]|uniref:FG-GAP-like repeat-containing protein n=1 Tax=Flammeovirga sp. OC4 TaxID=1382345 RepID=UPI0005C68514|nr:FG-GAP-like repeat-containing protein [Flammeovirga sp. OC4]
MKFKNTFNSRSKRQLKRKIETLITLQKNHSNYNSLSCEVKRLFNKVFQFSTNKTFQKCLSTAILYCGINSVNAQSFEAPIHISEFANFQITDAGTPSMYKPALVDIDNDGDLDFFYGSNPDLYFVENTGDKNIPNFESAPVASPFDFKIPFDHPALEPSFVDIDNDGDYDLFISVYEYGDLYYYENTGTPTAPQFAKKEKNAFGFEVTGEIGEYSTNASDFVDLDNDGDYDLLVVDYYGEAFYYENVGDKGNPHFASPIKTPFGLPEFQYNDYGLFDSPISEGTPVFNDIDNDGDQDLLVGTWDEDIQFFENIGNNCSPQFTIPITNPFNLEDTGLDDIRREAMAFGDLDNDGDLDMILAGSQHPSMFFFEFNGKAPSYAGIGGCDIAHVGKTSPKQTIQREKGLTNNTVHFRQHQTYTSSDLSYYGASSDRFGWDVKTNATSMAIGSFYGHHGEGDQKLYQTGAVEMYKKNEQQEWEFHQKIYAFDHLNPASQFGAEVEINERFLIIGAPKAYDKADYPAYINTGFVYIYQKDVNGDWEELQFIKASTDRSSYFGKEISFSDSKMAIANTDNLFLYDWDEESNIWIETQQIPISSNTRIIEINDHDLFVGTPDKLDIYHYQKNKWTISQTTTINNASFISGELDQNQFILGQFKYNAPQYDSVKVFHKNENDRWELESNIALPYNTTHQYYGHYTQIKDDFLLIASDPIQEKLLNGHKATFSDILLYKKSNGEWLPHQALVYESDKGIHPRINIELADSSVYIGAPSESSVTEFKAKSIDKWEYRSLGCEVIYWKDSIITTPQVLADTIDNMISNVFVLGLPKVKTELIIKSSEPYLFNNDTLIETTGEYHFTLQNEQGCDSLVSIEYFKINTELQTEDCSIAPLVKEGFYAVKNNGKSPFYKFIAEDNGWLTISTCGITEEETRINLYKECNLFVGFNEYACDDQAEVTLALSKGDSILFQMIDDEVYDDYIFEVSFIDDCYAHSTQYQDSPFGNNCASALEITEGYHRVRDEDTSPWYKYTALEAGTLKISTCEISDEDTFIEVYKDCVLDHIVDDKCWTNFYTEMDLEKGESITFHLSDRFDPDDYIFEVSFDQGCAEAERILISETKQVTSDKQWLEFKTEPDQWVNIVSPSKNDFEVFFSTCFDSLIGTSTISNDTASFELYSENCSSIFIYADIKEADHSYDISILPIPGTSCSSAIQLDRIGIYNAENSRGDQWFKYTSEKTGTLFISTLGRTSLDTWINLKQGCESGFINSSDDVNGLQSLVRANVTAGETYHFFINQRNNVSDPFEFEIGYTDNEGLTCDTALEITNNDFSVILSNETKYFKYTVPENGNVIFDFSNAMFVDVRLNSCQEQASIAYYDADVDEGQSITIDELQKNDELIFELSAEGFYQQDIQLTHNGQLFETVEISSCDPILFNEQDITETGTYYAYLESIEGYDSTVTLQFERLISSFTSIEESSCKSFIFGDSTYFESGTYYDTLINAVGCDSIIQLDLIINNPSYTIEEVKTCDSYDFNNQVITTSGTYFDTLTNDVGCDSIVQLELTINKTSYSVEEVKTCDSYDFNNQVITTSGTYFDTLTNTVGCDSIVQLDLIINKTSYTIEEVKTCENYDFNDQTITTSGTYFDTLTNAVGCDSIVQLDLIINKTSYSVEEVKTCESYDFNNQVITTSGTYFDTLTNDVGCDSIVQLDLIINKTSYSVEEVKTCESYDFNNQVITTSGTYFDTLTNDVGCDSIVQLDLIINKTSYSVEEVKTCESYDFNNQVITTSGTYFDTLTNDVGCDSIVQLDLIINKTSYSVEEVKTCESYDFNNQVITTSGTYFDTLTNAVGCDSIVQLDLIINKTSYSVEEVKTCESYDFNNQVITTSGTYFDTLTNAVGCDSIVQLDLIINKTSYSVEEVKTCESYDFNNQVITTSGTYFDTLTNDVGCDSIVQLELTINKTSYSVEEVKTCDSYDFNNQVITTSGTYFDTLTNTVGCDSIVQLDLIINKTSYTIEEVKTCENYDFNDQTITTSGTYFDTLTNAVGCDSIVQLDLIINKTSYSVEEVKTCESYDFNDQTITTSGTYFDTLTNDVGCDSIVQLDLIINKPSYSVEEVKTCDSYDFNDQTITTSGTYFDTLTNDVGCDSIVQLDLIIHHAIQNTIEINTCENYDFNGELLTSTGIYTQTLTSSVGCDSVVTIDYTKTVATLDEIVVETCISYDFNGRLLSSSGIYYDTLRNEVGCDSSILKLDLILHEEGSDFCKEEEDVTSIELEIEEVNIFPSPFTDKINISFQSIKNNINVKIYAMNGGLVSSSDHQNTQSIEKYIKGTSGIYIVYITVDNATIPIQKTIVKL